MDQKSYEKQLQYFKADSLQEETDSGKSNATSSHEQLSDEKLKQLEEIYIYEEDFISDVSSSSSSSTTVQVADDDVSSSSSLSTTVQVADDTTCKLPLQGQCMLLLSPSDNKLSSDSSSSIETILSVEDEEEKPSSHNKMCQYPDDSIQDERIQTPPHNFHTTFTSKKSFSLLSKRSEYIHSYRSYLIFSLLGLIP